LQLVIACGLQQQWHRVKLSFGPFKLCRVARAGIWRKAPNISEIRRQVEGLRPSERGSEQSALEKSCVQINKFIHSKESTK
jgi:hypothetical protein